MAGESRLCVILCPNMHFISIKLDMEFLIALFLRVSLLELDSTTKFTLIDIIFIFKVFLLFTVWTLDYDEGSPTDWALIFLIILRLLDGGIYYLESKE